MIVVTTSLDNTSQIPIRRPTTGKVVCNFSDSNPMISGVLVGVGEDDKRRHMVIITSLEFHTDIIGPRCSRPGVIRIEGEGYDQKKGTVRLTLNMGDPDHTILQYCVERIFL